MRKATNSLLASVTLAACSTIGHAGEPEPLRPGLYEASVRLELPFLDSAAAEKSATICVTSSTGNTTQGSRVLSENNPLAHCPASNVRRVGNVVTFDIVCAGANSARASATYTLQGEHFNARIAMKMGGKNMTMTESQDGHRIGDCEASGRQSELRAD